MRIGIGSRTNSSKDSFRTRRVGPVIGYFFLSLSLSPYFPPPHRYEFPAQNFNSGWPFEEQLRSSFIFIPTRKDEEECIGRMRVYGRITMFMCLQVSLYCGGSPYRISQSECPLRAQKPRYGPFFACYPRLHSPYAATNTGYCFEMKIRFCHGSPHQNKHNWAGANILGAVFAKKVEPAELLKVSPVG